MFLWAGVGHASWVLPRGSPSPFSLFQGAWLPCRLFHPCALPRAASWSTLSSFLMATVPPDGNSPWARGCPLVFMEGAWVRPTWSPILALPPAGSAVVLAYPAKPSFLFYVGICAPGAGVRIQGNAPEMPSTLCGTEVTRKYQLTLCQVFTVLKISNHFFLIFFP